MMYRTGAACTRAHTRTRRQACHARPLVHTAIRATTALSPPFHRTSRQTPCSQSLPRLHETASSPPSRSPYARHLRLVVGGAVPQRYRVVVEAHGHDGAADLVGALELLAHDGEHQLLPQVRRQALAQLERPLAAPPVRLVLPHGLDAVA